MKILEKKAESESLHTLNEQEIQKRLYGRYHLETGVKVNASKAHNDASKLELPKLVKPSVVSARLKGFAFRFQSVLVSVGRKFPWVFAGIITAALVLSILLLQILSIWFGKMSSPTPQERLISETKERIASATRETGAAKPGKAAKREVKTELPSTSVLSPATVAEPEISAQAPEAPARKYYAVQVCTYQKESDASRLTNELKEANFDAFYLRMASSQQRQPHYVVFLGKEETYAGANSKLSAFRKTRYFDQFSDSYIRSI